MISQLSNMDRFRMSLVVQDSRGVCDHADKVLNTAAEISHKNDDIVLRSHFLIERLQGRERISDHAAAVRAIKSE